MWPAVLTLVSSDRNKRGTADLTFGTTLSVFLRLLAGEDDPDPLFCKRELAVGGDTEPGLLVKYMLDAVELPKLACIPTTPTRLLPRRVSATLLFLGRNRRQHRRIGILPGPPGSTRHESHAAGKFLQPKVLAAALGRHTTHPHPCMGGQHRLPLGNQRRPYRLIGKLRCTGDTCRVANRTNLVIDPLT